jgi:hypothetical protein
MNTYRRQRQFRPTKRRISYLQCTGSLRDRSSPSLLSSWHCHQGENARRILSLLIAHQCQCLEREVYTPELDRERGFIRLRRASEIFRIQNPHEISGQE